MTAVDAPVREEAPGTRGGPASPRVNPAPRRLPPRRRPSAIDIPTVVILGLIVTILVLTAWVVGADL